MRDFKHCYIVLLLLYICSCSKNEGKDCAQNTYSYTNVYNNYQNVYTPGPCFNPTNNQEFAYTISDYQDTAFSIFNTTTNTITKVAYSDTLHLRGRMNWGRNNKLIFSVSASLYSSGTVITDATGTNVEYIPGGTTNPLWSPACDKLLLQGASGPSSTDVYIKPLQANTTYQVNLPGVTDYDWGTNEQIAIAYHNKYIDIYDTTLHLIKTIRVITDDYLWNCIFSIKWVPGKQKVVWACFNGVFITDVNTGITTTIKISTNDVVYKNISISADGSTLVVFWEKWNCDKAEPYRNSQWQIYKRHYSIINVLTLAEREISLTP